MQRPITAMASNDQASSKKTEINLAADRVATVRRPYNCIHVMHAVTTTQILEGSSIRRTAGYA